MKIEIPYTPRPLQAELHKQLEKHRWSVIACHRRFGKTVMVINHLIRAAIQNKQKNPRYALIAPSYKQAKSVAWTYVKDFAGAIPGTRFHETELRADLPNGARIQLLGAENPDSLRGIYLDGACLDEMADMPESLFPEVIRPALSDRNSKESPTWAVFIGTPRGHNMFYDLYEKACVTEGWFAQTYPASKTGVVDEMELEAARTMMTSDQYEQEFECSWVANVPGSIYGKELTKAMEEGRICDVPYDSQYKVDTWFDLGIGDMTAVWFSQTLRGGRINLIDYYENRNEGLPHYVHVLQKKGYLYGTHNAPHDIEVRELGTGKSRREIAWDLGLNFRVVPKLPVDDGLHAGQMLVGRCYFDRINCKEGLEALRQYHRAYNEHTRSFRLTPVHDWSADAADAFRYMAIGIREMRNNGAPTQRFADMDYNPFGPISSNRPKTQENYLWDS